MTYGGDMIAFVSESTRLVIIMFYVIMMTLLYLPLTLKAFKTNEILVLLQMRCKINKDKTKICIFNNENHAATFSLNVAM